MYILLILWLDSGIMQDVQGFVTLSACQKAVTVMVTKYAEAKRRSVHLEFDEGSFLFADIAVGACVHDGTSYATGRRLK